MGTIRAFMFHDIRNLENTIYPERYNLKSFLNEEQFKFQVDKIRNKVSTLIMEAWMAATRSASVL